MVNNIKNFAKMLPGGSKSFFKIKTGLCFLLVVSVILLWPLARKLNFQDWTLINPLKSDVAKSDERRNPKEVCNQCAPDDIMCHQRNLSQWNKIFSSPTVRMKPLFPNGTYTFSWEKGYLSFPPLVDIMTLPSLALSTVTIDGEKQGWVACDVGQRLTGRLDVKDGYGRHRQDGLDEVRVWMMDDQNTRRRAAGQVKDFRNGSYGLEITCLWPGSISKLKVALFYPREFVRATIQQKISGHTRFIAGLFTTSNPDHHEITLCSPYSILSGRESACICNLTSFNGREFYCGKPLDKRLNCSHWSAIHPLNIPPPYQLKVAEKQAFDIMQRSINERVVETIFTNTSTSGNLPFVPHCSAVPRKFTWEMATRPQGFWNEQGSWESLQCKTSKFRGQSFYECLKNSTVYVIGDSNAYRMFKFLIQGEKAKYIPVNWFEGFEVENTLWNILFKFFPHDLPLFLGFKWVPNLRYGSVEQIIDRIPSTGQQLVILHYYLHMTPFHLSVARSRLEAAAKAIERLLRRNPEARVAFRGPHTAYLGWFLNPALGGDVLGKQYLDIISTAFINLKDKVIFLDGWEMTVALENSDFHPDDRVPNEMVYKFMSFLCK